MQHASASAPPRRRARQTAKRSRTIRFGLTEAEFGEIEAAADRIGLAKGAFAAQAALAVARGAGLPDDSPVRQALSEFIRAAGLVRRIGVNLNQAVARLNATGQHSGDLLPYAAKASGASVCWTRPPTNCAGSCGNDRQDQRPWAAGGGAAVLPVRAGPQ